MYRWPTSQKALPDEGRARKTFDIYGLGVVLVEIAHWKPIEKVMGLAKDDTAVTSSEARSVRTRLLEEPEHLQHVFALVGERYCAAVRSCLEGPTAFGLADDDNQTNAVVAVRLQQSYTKRIVRELQSISV